MKGKKKIGRGAAERPRKVYSLAALVKIRRRLKREGKTVVFTNGCFDLLHAGHIRLFREAKKLGDVLIVALNRDASVRKIKGPARPIYPLRERLEILEAIEDIDYLTSFGEVSSQKTIATLLPDVLIKGGDWGPQQVVGRESVEAAGGKVVQTPHLMGHSTSAIVSKIVRSAISVVVVLACVFRAPAVIRPEDEKGSPKIRAAEDGLALTPPMGWYPWNIFGEEPQNEKLIKEIVDALAASGLKDAGYAYVGPDEGICFRRGPDGKLTSNLQRYPSGLKGLGEYIHRKGLKYALYTDAGIHTCSKAMPGTKGYEFEDMRAFADWRADYIKIDWCNTEGQDIVATYGLLGEAQRAAGRPVVHSLCSWGDGYPWRWASASGHMWRTTADICAPGKADWERAMRMALANEKLAAFAGPGHWNDPDMMIAGMPGLTEAQNRSFFSLWCMMAAPLIAGNDLRGMAKSTIDILTNLETIAVDQDPLGIQGRIVWTNGNLSVWAEKPLFDGSRAVLIFNRGNYPTKKWISWPEIGFAAEDEPFVRNLWTRETSGSERGGVFISVPPNDVAMLRVSRKNEFPIPPIIVADTYLISVRADSPRPEKLSGVVTITNKGSVDLPPWRIVEGLPAWLSVTVRGGGKSQTFVNTVSTAGLKKGLYHAVVRADNVEPVSGRAMSALYYDVDLEVIRDVGRAPR